MVGLGRYLFALAAASVGFLALAYGDYAPAWHAFPAGVPGRELWIGFFALILIAASLGLCIPRTAMPSLLVIGAYYLIWAVIASAPIPGSLGTYCTRLSRNPRRVT